MAPSAAGRSCAEAQQASSSRGSRAWPSLMSPACVSPLSEGRGQGGLKAAREREKLSVLWRELLPGKEGGRGRGGRSGWGRRLGRAQDWRGGWGLLQLRSESLREKVWSEAALSPGQCWLKEEVLPIRGDCASGARENKSAAEFKMSGKEP